MPGKGVEQRPRDGSWHTVPNRRAIHLQHGFDEAGGTGQEHLPRFEQLLFAERPLFCAQPGIVQQTQQRVTGAAR